MKFCSVDVMTDNHWLPTVHITVPESGQLLEFLAAHPAATGVLPAGRQRPPGRVTG